MIKYQKSKENSEIVNIISDEKSDFIKDNFESSEITTEPANIEISKENLNTEISIEKPKIKLNKENREIARVQIFFPSLFDD